MAKNGEDRRAFRRRLGVTLARVRSQLTDHTQATIAERLDVDPETVGRWERGDREMKPFDLHQLWRAYDVPAEWLLDPTDSVSELERRVAALRAERIRRAARGAAEQSVAGEQARRDAGAASPPRRTPPPRTRPQSP